MPYLMCENCGGYCQIPKDAAPENFDCQNCGGRLNLIEELYESSSKEETISTTISISRSFYKRIAILGIVVGIVGIVLHYYALIQPLLNANQFLEAGESGLTLITPFFILSLMVVFIGVSLFLYGNRKHTQIKQQIKYAHLESVGLLSSSYSVFNNVKIPDKKSIQQIIVGPTGIFVIYYMDPKNYLIINEDRWYYKRGSKKIPTMINAANVIQDSVMEIKTVLDSQYIPIEDDQIVSIVSFENNNYNVEKQPVNYYIIDLDNIVDFITNHEIRVSDDVLKRTGDILKYLGD